VPLSSLYYLHVYGKLLKCQKIKIKQGMKKISVEKISWEIISVDVRLVVGIPK